MKTTIKVFLYLLSSFSLVTVSGCSKDDPIVNNPTPVQPENPGSNKDPDSDLPNKPDLAKELLGEWALPGSDFGILVNVTSTSRMTFSASDSLTIDWYETEKANNPYTTARGKYTINGDSLKVEWISVVTDSVANIAFTTFYLSGECSVADNTLDYIYSVYDTNGSKLSGPHSTKLAKQ